MDNHFDLLILGSGSTAFAAALRAVEFGKTAAMTEMRTLGGTCVNRGCLPSKNLIEAARIVWESAHPRYKGLKPVHMEMDFGELISQKQEVVHSYRDKKYQSIVYEEDKIRVYNGQARLIDNHTALVGVQKVSGDQILIATGTRPAIPQIDGLDQISYLTSDLLTSDESQELKELPESLVIIGGGYIALELGQMFHRFGTRVAILERSEVILHDYEPEVSEVLTLALRDEGIHLVTGAQVVHVSQKSADEIEVVACIGDKEQTFKAQKLLVATGREPNTDNAGLDKVGVQLDEQGFVKVNNVLQTNVPNIWRLGMLSVVTREPS